jgi:predicted NUDIX family NTP pyrophosphohydrolase
MDCTAAIKSNSFSLEWPKGSGRIESFPEIDRAAWFSLEAARTKLVQGQVPLLNQLLAKLPQL